MVFGRIKNSDPKLVRFEWTASLLSLLAIWLIRKRKQRTETNLEKCRQMDIVALGHFLKEICCENTRLFVQN
jgi:hypothetical protein